MNDINRKIAALRGGEQALIQGASTVSGDAGGVRLLDYEHDLNAALCLALEIPRFSLTKTASGLYLEWYQGGWYEVTIKSPQDLASGICMIYLMWKEVKNE